MNEKKPAGDIPDRFKFSRVQIWRLCDLLLPTSATALALAGVNNMADLTRTYRKPNIDTEFAWWCCCNAIIVAAKVGIGTNR